MDYINSIVSPHPAIHKPFRKKKYHIMQLKQEKKFTTETWYLAKTRKNCIMKEGGIL